VNPAQSSFTLDGTMLLGLGGVISGVVGLLYRTLIQAKDQTIAQLRAELVEQRTVLREEMERQRAAMLTENERQRIVFVAEIEKQRSVLIAEISELKGDRDRFRDIVVRDRRRGEPAA